MNWYTNFTTLFWFSSFYFKKGDECDFGNVDLGTCKLLTECSSAVQMIQNNQNPVLCSYNKYMPMVCCPDTINQISTTELILDEAEILTTQRNITPTKQNSISNAKNTFATPLTKENNSTLDFQITENTNQDSITTPNSNVFITQRNADEPKIQLNIDMPTTQLSNVMPTVETSSNSPMIEARTIHISNQECSSFQNIKPKQGEKLDYRDAEQEKLEKINNEIAEFPYRVVLGVSTADGGNLFVSGGIKWQCGGSLISNKFVLTAAHCLYYKNLEWANIGNALLHTYLGLTNPQQVLYKIIRRIPHPLYKAPSLYHNIGLVELDKPVQFTLYTRPACLHVDQDIDPNTQLKAAGWGLGNFGETNETLVKLQNVDLDLFTEDECERTYKDLSDSGRLSTGISQKEQFCAGARSDITNTCKIFSGGALQFDVISSSNSISYIAGIKSFGNTCGLRGIPSVYTRVAAYVPWIESVVWPQSHDHINTSQPISDATETLSSSRSTTSLSDEKCTYLKIGQVNVQPREFPHMVALGKSDKNDNDTIWICGGTLISAKFVLTSAYCLDVCEGVYKSFYGNTKNPNGILHDFQFCAGGHIGIQDTCLVDSGSPLQFKISDYTGNIWHIIGVETAGTKCGQNGLPRIYTRVAPYVPWIESIVWPNSPATQTVSYPSLIHKPLTRLTTSLNNRKCLFFREAELKERILIFKPSGGAGYGGTGGTDAGAGEFPHMVALGFSKSAQDNDIAWQCGGSLLSEKFVLTAAHCLVSRDLGNIKWALLGTTRTDAYLKLTQSEPLLRKIIRRIKHPLYKLPGKYHDIALVELDRPVAVFTKNIRPACLYTTDKIDASTQVIGTGWGLTERGNISIDLQKINLNLFTDDECNEAYEYLKGMRQLRSGISNSNQICAGGRHGIQDTCPGDSGGPLQFRDNMIVWQIIGITSFGKTCGLQGVPGVYTRVAAYVPWIESIVWPDEYIYKDEPEIIDA